MLLFLYCLKKDFRIVNLMFVNAKRGITPQVYIIILILIILMSKSHRCILCHKLDKKFEMDYLCVLNISSLL
jgi:hypothetical protein